MGTYLNRGNNEFKEIINGKIYVDKTDIIKYINDVVETPNKYVCISRPRRFGKSFAAKTLRAYYDKTVDSYELFKKYKISKCDSFKKHLNKYNVISLDMQSVLTRAKEANNIGNYINKYVVEELIKSFNNVGIKEDDILPIALEKIYNNDETKFIFIIDEWDALFRKYSDDVNSQNIYLEYLNDLLKEKPYVALVYMTGILPIKKYGTHSALNMFSEYSMIDTDFLSEFTGFTESEVKSLCKQYKVDFNEIKEWYNGYVINDIHIYNPKSVYEAMSRKRMGSFWTATETYDALKMYMDLNYDGLKDKIVRLLSGENIVVDIKSFRNDFNKFESSDDVLTLLIHLGYLGYDFNTKSVFIPNKEIREEFITAVKNSNYGDIVKTIQKSEQLLSETINGNSEYVASALDEAHMEYTSLFKYNDENSLTCVVSLAYYYSQNYYNIYREVNAGVGRADLLYMPKPNADKPAMIIELKWNKTADSAITQIKNKKYPSAFKSYKGEIILVGINYDKDTKKHECVIEKIKK